MYKSEPPLTLVELQSVSPGIRLDIVYATSMNFTGSPVYSCARCFLVRKAAERLHRVQTALAGRGLGLKVYDGYRPRSVQKILWDFCPNPLYVADPARGSKHNRGASVDVALVDAQGRDLPMPSGYDDFSERAHRDYSGCTPEEAKNRTILEAAMCQEGFVPYREEWWHFDDPEWEKYPLLDIPLESL